MLRRRPSQVPLGAASEAQRALLAAISPSSSSSSGGRSSSRRKRLALGVAAALAAAALFAVGVVLGVSSSTASSTTSDPDAGIAASARMILKGKLFSGVANDARRSPGVPRKLGSGVVAVPKGANSNNDDDDTDDEVDGPIEAYLVVYSHVDPGWLLTVDQYYEKGFKSGQNGVRKILDEIVPVLERNPARKYTWGETVYLERWWRDQTDEMKSRVRALVSSGQLGFAGGGWVSPDEATSHFRDMVDQYALGHQWLSAELGMRSPPAVGWQIDTFGHSQAHAALLGSMGMRSVYFSRIDTEDRLHRASKRQLEFLWDAAPGRSPVAEESELWCYAFHRGQYDIPVELEDLQVDAGGRRLSGNGGNGNAAVAAAAAAAGDNTSSSSSEPSSETRWEQRLANVTAYVRQVAERTRGGRGPVMVSISRDFGWDAPGLLYDNLDELVARSLADPARRVRLRYATAEEHAAARRRGEGVGRKGGKKKEKAAAAAAAAAQGGLSADGDSGWPVQQGDLMPYSDCKGCYWSGYFSTRPGTKRLVREASGLLAAARQLEAWVGGEVASKAAAGSSSSSPSSLSSLSLPPTTVPLERAVALMQHHDAITGTDRLEVNRDYRRIVSEAAGEARRLVAAALDALVLRGARDFSTSTSSDSSSATAGSPPPPSLSGGGNNNFWSSHERSFALCEAANASVCTPAVALTTDAATRPFTVAAYNPLPRPARALVRVPLGPAAMRAGRRWRVSAPEVGSSSYASSLDFLPSGSEAQVVLLSESDLGLQRLAELGGAGDDNNAIASSAFAAGHAVFDAQLPPLGYVAFAVEPESGGENNGSGAAGAGAGALTSAAAAAAAPPPPPPPPSSPCSSFPANCTEDESTLTLSNGLVDLVFAKKAGVLVDAADTAPQPASGLARVRTRPGGSWSGVVGGNGGGETTEASVRASLLSYSHDLTTSVLPWFLRRSGHYAFHPEGEASKIDSNPDEPLTSLVVGPVVSQVTRRYGDFGQLTFRLAAGAANFEVEWTVGPLPGPQDVVLRFDTDLDSSESRSSSSSPSTSPTVFVDSNGREFLKRQRASRSTWALAPLDQPYANDIGRDYYPMTSGAYIEDDDDSSDESKKKKPSRQFSVVPDRAQGVASLANGQLEVMLHREARISDELGNPETLRDEDSKGRAVVVRGTHLVALTGRREGARARRALASAAGSALPVVAFSARPPASPGAAAGALLAAPLPESVELLKLAPRRRRTQGSGGGGSGGLVVGQGVEIRLAHAFEQGEDGAAGGGAGINGGRDGGGALSLPVDVDLAASFGAAFAPFEVTDLTVSGMDKVAEEAAATNKGEEPTGSSLPHGERIFNGPLLFDYEKLDEPGKEIESAEKKYAPPPALIPKPARQVPAPLKRNARIVRLAPLEIRSLALTRPGAKEEERAEALATASKETLLSLSSSLKTSAVA